MAVQKKSVRKLVTLPADLAERVEKFRQTSGASSESDALKVLIEDGLKRRDTPEDIFQRCVTATASGQSLGDIINLVTADHPLVDKTIVDSDSFIIYLKLPGDVPDERFRYSRAQRKWFWENHSGGFDEWSPLKPDTPTPSGGFGSGPDLDDEIPF